MPSQKKISGLSPRLEMLLREYQYLVPQIIHWDSHFWTKSQFFLVVESGFVAVVLQTFKEQVSVNNKLPNAILVLFLIVGFFNMYLCYVWFRTNRRNREYLRFRINRAIEIESESELNGVIRTFTNVKNEENLPSSNFKNHGSSDWETYLPIGFMVIWIALIGFVAVYAYCNVYYY